MSFLTKKLINATPDYLGLDISDLSLKAVQIKKTADASEVIGINSVPLAQDVVVDGAIMKPDVFTEALKKLRAGSDLNALPANHIVCSLPEIKAFLRIIQIPKMDEEEAREAVKWEMGANIPLSIDQVHYDWQISDRNFSKDKTKMSVIVVAVPRIVIDQYLGILEAEELKVIGLEIESIAQTRSLITTKKKNHTSLIVDIGDRRTSFVIALDGIPCFTSSIPLSSHAMTDAIAKALGISIEEAEKTKRAYGVGSALKNDHIFTALKPVLENFVQEINKSVGFYLTELKYSDEIDEVLLCGGGAKTKGIVPYLSRRLGRNISFGDPWVNVNLGKRIPPINREESVQYATAIGLSLKDFTL